MLNGKLYDNLRAYTHNFGYIRIEEGCNKDYYVYTSKENYEKGDYTQYCYNIDYLNGWLYGAVQANCKRMKPITALLDIAREKGGFRENDAVDVGILQVVEINGHECWKFTYDENREYQDGNGATFDTVRKEWIG